MHFGCSHVPLLSSCSKIVSLPYLIAFALASLMYLQSFLLKPAPFDSCCCSVPKRNVRLDPHAVLLDAAFFGELEAVQWAAEQLSVSHAFTAVVVLMVIVKSHCWALNSGI